MSSISNTALNYIVGENELLHLQPYVLQSLEMSTQSKTLSHDVRIIKLSDEPNRAAFRFGEEITDESQEILKQIQEICRQNLTEQLIVFQYMGPNALPIRHRVIDFEIQDNLMLVKYVPLGELTNFNAVMNKIRSLYGVLCPYHEAYYSPENVPSQHIDDTLDSITLSFFNLNF